MHVLLTFSMLCTCTSFFLCIIKDLYFAYVRIVLCFFLIDFFFYNYPKPLYLTFFCLPLKNNNYDLAMRAVIGQNICFSFKHVLKCQFFLSGAADCIRTIIKLFWFS